MTRIIIAALVALVVSGPAWAADEPIRWKEWDVYSCEGERKDFSDSKYTEWYLHFHRLFVRNDGTEVAVSEQYMDAPLPLVSSFKTFAAYRLKDDWHDESLSLGKFGSFESKWFFWTGEGEGHISSFSHIISRCMKNPPTVFDYDIYKE